ncbi:creatininase family protein [Kribbella hippodromi]|uniref:Creatininase family protein n=1 Tax=Kribbella hippodromi TaxID=434347 RepID=A0ABN2EE04_9ACTN
MTELSRLTTVEAASSLRTAKVAILPIGATEQHGPHLELRTDTTIATVLARMLATDLGADAVLLPPIPYGLSEHHLPFAGTITLRPQTLRSLLLDVFESVAHHGVRRVIVLNGHGGNIDAIRLAAREARRDSKLRVAHVMWAQLGRDVVDREAGPSWRRNHACEIETSLAMVLDDSLVRPSELDVAPLTGPRDPFTEPVSASVDVPIWFDEWTANGALGDPRRASVERGQAIVEVVRARAAEFARSFVADER